MNKKLKSLKYVFIGILLGVAFYHLDDIYHQLKTHELSIKPIIGLFLFSILSLILQAYLSKTICLFCNKQLNLFKSLAINVYGALLGIIMPMGSVSYKAIYLKNTLGLSYTHYASFYGISVLAAFNASLLLLLILCFTASSDIKAQLFIFIINIIGNSVIFLRKPLARMLNASWAFKIREILLYEGFYHKYLKLFIIHCLSLSCFIAMYFFAFKSFNTENTLFSIAALVAVQNLLFLIPLIPGNLVILESTAAWMMQFQNIHHYDTVLAVLLLRATSIFCIILLVFVSNFALPLKNFIKNRELS